MKRIALFFFIFTFFQLNIFAQKQSKFQFPKNFSKDNYLSNTIVYKLKGEDVVSKSAHTATPISDIDEKNIVKLGATNIQPLFPADNFIFQHTDPSKIGHRTKKLSLIYTLEIDAKMDLETAINLLRQDPAVEYAEPVYTNHKPLLVPNDPLASTNSQYHLTAINAFDAWDFAQGDPSMIIGIIDNGANINNSDLNANYHAPVFIDTSFDLLNDISGATTGNLFDSDNNVIGGTHGQNVALAAAAVPNNNTGTVGTGFNCSFLPVKVAPDDNLNNYIDGYGGILFAAKQGCKVINMSWGRTGPPSSLEEDILQSVFEDDIVLIAAAGNDNDQDLFFPASYDMVLSVAATNSFGTKADFSSFNSRVDISAPGADLVVSTGATASGTSFAAPLVAGAAGLIRVQHPEWDASQVMARLITTSDNLYDNPLNESFRGLLGIGQLNMFRAVTDSLKAITLDSCTFNPMDTDGYLINGSTATMNLFICNHLNALSDLRVTVRSESPYIQVVDSVSQLGAITENARFNTFSDELQISIDDNTPANTVARLVIEYWDNNYSYSEDYEVLLNPGNISNNFLEMAVNDNGELAVYNNAFDATGGIQFATQNMLTEAGLMIGIEEPSGAVKVSDAVRFDINSRNDDFTVIDALSKNTDGALLSSVARFEDITDNSERIGLEISQRTFAWNENELNRAVILEYQITNLSANSDIIENPYIGIFANWDINNPEENASGWDADNLLGYAYDTNIDGLYGGIVLLTDRPDRLNREPSFVSYYTFDPTNFDTNVNIFDGFDAEEKFEALSSEILQSTAGTSGNGNDVYQIIGSRFDDLEVGETRSMAFAFVVAETLEDLQTNAIAIKNRFTTIKTSPVPVVQNIAVCKNEDAIIRPTNGSNFNFYITPPENDNVNPIFTGSALNVNNITIDQTFYVTSVDSIFESGFVEVMVSVSDVMAGFDTDKPIVDINVENSLNLLNNSQNASNFTWKIKREEGNVNEDITFINSTNANSEAPQLSFNQPGDYTITLVTMNTENCTDSTTIDYEVIQSITTGISTFLKNNLKISPNPAIDFLAIQLPDYQNDIRIEIVNTYGNVVKSLNLDRKKGISQKLSLEGLPAGVYYLKAYEGQDYYTLRFVKI